MTERETAAGPSVSTYGGHEAVDLIRALMKGAGLGSTHSYSYRTPRAKPGAIRQVIRAYLTKTILETKHEGTRISALNILDVFSQPFAVYDGISPVILAVGKIHYEQP